MEARSVGFGGLSLCLAVAFYLLSNFMDGLPFGDNDFDLILLGIMLSSIALFFCASLLTIVAMILAIIDLVSSSPRWVPAIGLVAGISAAALLACSLMCPI